MKYLFRILIFVAVSASVSSAWAQTYPKYREKVKDTVLTKKKQVAMKVSADFDALMKKAFHEYRVKKFDEATATYTEAFEISPDSMKFRVLHLRAYCYFTNGKFTKAIEDCTAAIEKTKLPGDRALNELLALRSDAYSSRKEPGDKERACADYKKARQTAFMGKNIPLECP